MQGSKMIKIFQELRNSDNPKVAYGWLETQLEDKDIVSSDLVERLDAHRKKLDILLEKAPNVEQDGIRFKMGIRILVWLEEFKEWKIEFDRLMKELKK